MNNFSRLIGLEKEANHLRYLLLLCDILRQLSRDRPCKRFGRQSRFRIVLLAALAFVSVIGPTATSQQTSEPLVSTPSPPSSAASVDPNDPAEIQRRFVQTINSAMKKAELGLKTPRQRKLADSTGGSAIHTYSAEYTGKLSYDIRKTDSLVSPCVGFVSWEIKWYHNGKFSERESLNARYAYQNGTWVITNLTRDSSMQNGISANEYLSLFQ